MEKILEQILGELKGLNTGQDRLEMRMDGLDSKLTSVDTKVDRLDNKVIELDSKVDHLDTKFIELDGKVDRLDTKFIELDGKVDRLDTKFIELDGKVDLLDTKVDDLKSSIIHGLAPYFNNIEKHIDHTNDKVLSTLKKQQEAIDLLSARSIQQEADTKALSRLVRNQ